MKKIFTLCTAILAVVSLWGTETVVTIESGDGVSDKVPANFKSEYTVVELLYPNSMLSDIKSGDIISTIRFKLKQSATFTRKWKVYMSLNASYSTTGSTMDVASNLVFDGDVTVKQGWFDVVLTNAFTYSPTKDTKALQITIYDYTSSSASSFERSCYVTTTTNNQSAYKCQSSIMTPTSSISSASTLKVLPNIQFVLGGTPTPTYDKPTEVSVSSITSSSVTISWTKKSEAKIKLQYSVKGAGNWTTESGITASSYNIIGLSSDTQYDYKVIATYDDGAHESEAVTGSFTTAESAHIHNGITFKKWESTTSLPTKADNYYLANDVSVNGWDTPDGTTNLCLNGKTITLGEHIIDVDATLNIYDCKGGGKITSTKGSLTDGTIKVEYNGTLSISAGTIENTKEESEYSYAVFVVSTGKLNLSGAPILRGNKASINLYSAEYSKITIAGAITKPASPYKVKTSGSTITSGWNAHMSAANPSEYFVSTVAGQSTAVVDDEVQFVSAISLSDEVDNFTTLNTNVDKTVNVNMTRSFTNASYNTICLPFDLDKNQIESVFGDETVVQELTESSLSDNGTTLTLGFEEVTSITGGVPYIIKPQNNVVNPIFSQVKIITDASQVGETEHVKFIGTFSKTPLTVGTKEVLFLAANNELVWAQADGDLKGMRAYFRITYSNTSKIGACRVSLGRNATTDLPSLDAQHSTSGSVQKVMQNGQLVIIRDGKTYTIYGQPLQ